MPTRPALVNKAPRRVLFSTPQPSPNISLYTPPAIAVHREIQPPYTPVGQLTNYGPPAAPHQIPSRAAMQMGHMKVDPAHPARQNISPAFQAITAASQALRINLGLDHGPPAMPHCQLGISGMLHVPMFGGLSVYPVSSAESLAQLPGAPVLPPQSVFNKTPSTSVQTQLLSSLFPVSGQVQPAISQAALPPVCVKPAAPAYRRTKPSAQRQYRSKRSDEGTTW